MSQLIRSKLPCPTCSSSDAYHEYDDGHGYCFSCQTYFPPNGDFNISREEEFSYEYLPWRGVSKETFAFYGVKTKVDRTGTPVCLGFEYPNGSYKVRQLQRKSFHAVGDIAKAGLFGRNKFAAGSHKYVTITEGELDACSLYQVLRSPVVSVHSAGTAAKDCIVDRQWLDSFERIYLAFDNDAIGREAAANVARLFDFKRVFLVKLERKDANEYVQHGEQEELRNIWWNSKKYQPDSVISSFSDFKKILEEPPQRGLPYPWPTLNEKTYGIRRGESILITAMEGVGKTEIMHALEHQILKETGDEVGVGAIFLEEPKQRHLQAIAGVQLKVPAHLPDSGVGPSQVVSALEAVVKKDGRLFVYSHFGSDDPDVLLDTIRFLVTACDVGYILLDHVTMVVSGLHGEDERKALDYFSTRLEMMVKELNFALIMVSHVNDAGQTRGSRYISKIADIWITLVRDLLHDNPVIRNITHMFLSKNRYSGRTGPAGDLLFDPLTYTYTELGHEESSPLQVTEVESSPPIWGPEPGSEATNQIRDQVGVT